MDKIKEFLTNHRYFKYHEDQGETDGYFLEEEGKIYEIAVLKGFNAVDNNPITYDGDGSDYIQEHPFWFKKLFEEVYNLYYEKNRIRYLMNFGKKPFIDIVWIHSFYVENGKGFYQDTDLREYDGILETDIKWKSDFLNLIKKLKIEGYKIGELMEDEYLIWCSIN